MRTREAAYYESKMKEVGFRYLDGARVDVFKHVQQMLDEKWIIQAFNTSPTVLYIRLIRWNEQVELRFFKNKSYWEKINNMQ